MRRKLKSLPIRKILLPIGILLGLCLILFAPGQLIKINKIVCESQYGECPDSIESDLGKLDLSNITKTKKLLADNLDQNLLISTFSVQYGFPDKLKINILLKKPVAAIFDTDSNKFYLVGNDNQILGEALESSLPTVAQKGNIPDSVAISIMQGVNAIYQVTRGEIINDSLVVELPTHVRVIFPLDGVRDTEVLLGSLRLIYSEVTDKEIDLRFKNALLR